MGFENHLTFAKFSSSSNSTKTIEQLQTVNSVPVPAKTGVIINELKINNEYRNEAQEKREVRKTILFLHGGGYIFLRKESHHPITSSLAKIANARVLVINYRLAPQNQFPAALHDALAAYLYLLNPPKDAGFEPLNPKNIVFAGNSAGGGLSLDLGLAIRDAGLSSSGGIIGSSPWVDLTVSMPSRVSDECVDFIPNRKGGGTADNFTESQASKEYKEKDAALAAKIKNQNLGPKIWHDSFNRPGGRLQLYVANEGLAIPYTVGDDERLLDEVIYFAHRAAEPTKYKGPSYNAGKFEKSPFQTPTNTTLEIYEEMPHDFQMLMEHVCTTKSYERMAEFINRVTNILNEPLPPSSYNCVNVKGEFGPLKERHEKCLNWDKIGIVPS
ncbi:alpha/beta-hydrolase [Rhizophagus irregularis]|uniref:Alpha/beta-hydrolase n=1 Tax=Rhizophagus irregularis TaxID=588596 RepID=A0A2N1MN02_9GLOM|nr:alpha/beta-hydrolase [Rhizophagus irregularis]